VGLPPQTPLLSGKKLYGALVTVNIYQHTKCQCSKVVYKIDRGFTINWGLLTSPDDPYRTFFLHRALVPTYTYQHTKYKLPGSINLGVMEGVPK